MKEEIIQNINQGVEAAYINGNLASNLEYKPSFISNNPEEGKKVISSIEEELLRCEQFQLCAQLRVCNQVGGNPIYPRSSQPDNSESWDVVGNSN